MNASSTPGSSAFSATEGLARAIAAVAQTDGDHPTCVPALSLHRRKAPTSPLHCIFTLGLGVVAQGRKQVLLGEEVITYGPGQSMLTSIELPVISHVTHASTGEPLLGLMLALDRQAIVEVAERMPLPSATRPVPYRPISIERLDDRVIASLVRLVGLSGEPDLAPLLAPLLTQEIIVRLLAGPHATQLRHLVSDGSPSQQITKAVSWLKQNFSKPMQVDDLARRVGMSPSTFRQHFRAVTGTSPLQYQKQLRLQEARQLMLNQHVDAAAASGRVGYESASQFSREYSRVFGLPPQQDVRRMRLAA